MENDTRILTCVYCGTAYPDNTPSWGSAVLTEHIKVCEKHPMRKAEETIKKLRGALIGLVGAESKEELKQMLEIMTIMPDTAMGAKEPSMNAINVLLETYPV